MRVPWTARSSYQSILIEIGFGCSLIEIDFGCSLEGLTLKLRLQYFGYLIHRADSLEKVFILGKIEGRKRMAQQRMR